MGNISGIPVENKYGGKSALSRGVKSVNGISIFTGDKGFFQLRYVAGIFKLLVKLVGEIDKLPLKQSQYKKEDEVACPKRE